MLASKETENTQKGKKKIRKQTDRKIKKMPTVSDNNNSFILENNIGVKHCRNERCAKKR